MSLANIFLILLMVFLFLPGMISANDRIIEVASDSQPVATYMFSNDSMMVLLKGASAQKLDFLTLDPEQRIKQRITIPLPSAKHFVKSILPISSRQFRLVGSVLDASGSRIFHTVYRDFRPIRTLELDLPRNALINSVCPLPTGDFVLCGAVYDNSITTKDGLLVCVSPDWEIVWYRTLGGPEEDEFLDVCANREGTICAVGMSTRERQTRPWSVVLNPLGENSTEKLSELSWPGKICSVAGFEEVFFAVGEIDRGDVFGKDSYFRVLNISGELLNERSAAIKGDDQAADVIFGPDGYYYVCGTRTNGRGDINPYLWQFGKDIEKLSARTFRDLNQPVIPLSLFQLADGRQALLFSGKSRRAPTILIISGEPIIDYTQPPLNMQLVLNTRRPGEQMISYDQATVHLEFSNTSPFYLKDCLLTIATEPPVSTVRFTPASQNIFFKPGSNTPLDVKIETHGTPPNSTFKIVASLFSPTGKLMLQKELPLRITKPENIHLNITRFNIQNLSNPSAPHQTLYPGDSANVTLVLKNNDQIPLRNLKVKLETNSSSPDVVQINEKEKTAHISPGSSAEISFRISASPLLSKPMAATLAVVLEHAYLPSPRKHATTLQLAPAALPAASTSDSPAEVSPPHQPPRIAFSFPPAAQENAEAFALIIGNRNYTKAKSVDYAHADAEAIKDLCITSLGIRPGNIFLLKDATKAEFEIYFGNRSNPRGKLANVIIPGKSDVFIYYAGHGAPGLKDKKGYLVPSDCDPQFLEVTGYPLETLYENLSQLPARNITLVIDACFSGEDVHSNISPLLPLVANPVVHQTNIAMLNSSSGTQYATWYPEKGHSLFTYFFLKAFSEQASDENGDGELTVKEVFNFISDPLRGVPYWARRLHNAEQTPEMLGGNGGYILYRSNR